MSEVPWASKMRRVHAEWMAPEEVVQQVRLHYFEAINWLHDSLFGSWSGQWSGASAYLSGAFLKQHHQALLSAREGNLSFVVGVLRCDHILEVRHFSELGDDCLIVDHQFGRRMATYNRETQERSHTQDLGDGSVVYRLRYDSKARRWKIEAFVQELPMGWVKTRRRMVETTMLAPYTGRDS
ncbi:MAG: hypothetical protein IAE80_05580 [Anaerolinea sp.]|nr:hypothetical protein [Anaerolinea sp.]